MSQTKPFRHSKLSSRRVAAFSLVEVVLAIGIVSFAFVGMFGLLPVGLNTFRQAVDSSVGSQIVQRVINDAQQTDFPTLITSGTTTRYFDDQGNELKNSDSNFNSYIYTVEVAVSGTTALPGPSTSGSSNLATVTVRIANNPGHNPVPFGSASVIPYSSYSALIAKNTN